MLARSNRSTNQPCASTCGNPYSVQHSRLLMLRVPNYSHPHLTLACQLDDARQSLEEAQAANKQLQVSGARLSMWRVLCCLCALCLQCVLMLLGTDSSR